MNIIQTKIRLEKEVTEEELFESKGKSPFSYVETLEMMLYMGYKFNNNNRSFTPNRQE